MKHAWGDHAYKIWAYSEYNIKMDLKDRLRERELRGTSSELSPLSALCEHGNELKNEFVLCSFCLFATLVTREKYDCILMVYLTTLSIAWNGWMSSEEWIGRNMEGHVHDVIAILSWDFPGATVKTTTNRCN
jgi:hypothetical protein